MYEEFFKLKHKPFSLLPDPEFLFLSSKHALALSLLEYCLSGQAGFCVITGEIGSGKTTLVRAFLNRVGREFAVGIISNTHTALHDVSAWALSAFGRKTAGTTPADTYLDLMGYLIEEYGQGRQCILIVDEAQNLSIEALEELRLLSNINSGKDLLLQIVLVGQPELLTKLKRPELTQFAQRIAVSHHLTPLPYAETRRYIQHRLKVAGADQPIFTEMAMGAVQYFSGGVPRLINSICDLSLVYAFAEGTTEVNEDLVFRVISDRQSSGIAPFARNESIDDPSVRAEISNLAATPTDPAPSRLAPSQSATAAEPATRIEPVAQVATQVVSQAASQVALQAQASFAQPTLHQPRGSIPLERPRAQRSARQENEYFFRDGDSDSDLVLTAGTRPATDLHADQREWSVDPTASNRGARRTAHPETRPAGGPSEPAAVLRPSWNTPAGEIEADQWPSISGRPAKTPALTGLPRDQAGGTDTPPRRSWWRRGFSRGK